MEYDIKEISVDKIKPDKNQPRKSFPKEALVRLAENILSEGLYTPIEVDEDYVITDGERRWRAHKIAGIKTIPARIVKVKDKLAKEKRQIVYAFQDEEMTTDEKYNALVKLYKNEKNDAGDKFDKGKFCKEVGVSIGALDSAIEYCKFSDDEPELAKEVSPHIIIETASLPKEERKEVLAEFKGTKNKKKDLIRELVREKQDKLKLKKNLDEIKKTKDNSIIIQRTEETLEDLKKRISSEIMDIQKIVVLLKSVSKMNKLYVSSARDKESFFKFMRGNRDSAQDFVDELDKIINHLELEVIKE